MWCMWPQIVSRHILSYPAPSARVLESIVMWCDVCSLDRSCWNCENRIRVIWAADVLVRFRLRDPARAIMLPKPDCSKIARGKVVPSDRWTMDGQWRLGDQPRNDDLQRTSLCICIYWTETCPYIYKLDHRSFIHPSIHHGYSLRSWEFQWDRCLCGAYQLLLFDRWVKCSTFIIWMIVLMIDEGLRLAPPLLLSQNDTLWYILTSY